MKDSYEDWQYKMAAKRLRAALATEEGKAELKALFMRVDIDGDGKLTPDEWSQGLAANNDVIEKYFWGCSVADNREVFTKIDTDNSGALTWEEFLDGALKSITADVEAK